MVPTNAVNPVPLTPIPIGVPDTNNVADDVAAYINHSPSVVVSRQTAATRPVPNLSIIAPEIGANSPIISCDIAIARPNASRPTPSARVTGGRYSPIDSGLPIDSATTSHTMPTSS